MNFNIIGEYCFKIPLTTMFLNETILIKKKNLITVTGELFFLNRCINTEFKPMEYIAIGTGITPPSKTDYQLGNETKRNTATKIVDEDNKQLVLKTSFTANELIGATEIGVANDDILISHDVFEENEIKESFVNGVVGVVEVEYYFQFSSSHIRTGWIQHSSEAYSNIYYIYEQDNIISITDKNNNGYRKVTTLDSVKDIKGSYFHDVVHTNNLYVHTINDDNPSNEDLIIQTK